MKEEYKREEILLFYNSCHVKGRMEYLNEDYPEEGILNHIKEQLVTYEIEKAEYLIPAIVFAIKVSRMQPASPLIVESTDFKLFMHATFNSAGQCKIQHPQDLTISEGASLIIDLRFKELI